MQKTLTIKAIKKITDAKFILDGTGFAFIGKNGTGKSTAVQCLETIFGARSVMVNPVQDGKDSGTILYEGTDMKGNPIQIQWEVKKGESTGKFKALVVDNDKTKNITNVGKIQEIMGVYMPLNVQDALFMMKTAETRRRFVRDYIMPCLGKEELDRINEIDLEISDSRAKAFEGNKYHTRTEVKAEHESLLTQLKALEVDDKIKEAAENIEELKSELEGLKTQADELSDSKAEEEGWTDNLKKHSTALVELGAAMRKDQAEDHEFYEKIIQGIKTVHTELDNRYKEAHKTFSETCTVLDNLQQTIEERTLTITGIEVMAETVEKIKTTKASADEKFKEIQKLDNEIEELKAERAKIISESDLPAGLEFDEETITFDGFPFHETSVSETKANIAMINLMMNVSKSELINIGDWSKYDTDSRKEIMDLAKKENRMLLGQKVTEDKEVEMIVEMK